MRHVWFFVEQYCCHRNFAEYINRFIDEQEPLHNDKVDKKEPYGSFTQLFLSIRVSGMISDFVYRMISSSRGLLMIDVNV